MLADLLSLSFPHQSLQDEKGSGAKLRPRAALAESARVALGPALVSAGHGQCHTCAQQLPPDERSATTLPFAAGANRKDVRGGGVP